MKSNLNDVLYSKTGQAALLIASDLLRYQVGTKIKTVEEYLQETNFSRGTLHNALKIIEENELVQFEKRGQLGTFIAKIEYKKIWEFLNIASINIIMPLPYSKHYEGLATGLCAVFQELDIPTSILFLQGSYKRVAALEQKKVDITVLSYLAAKLMIQNHQNIEILHNFGNKTYLQNQVLMIAPKNNEIDIFQKDNLTVLYDKYSLDMKFLSEVVFRNIKNVKYVNYSYNQTIDKLLNNEADVAFWNEDELVEKHLALKTIEIKDSLIQKYIDDCSKACLVVNKDNHKINNLINNLINFDKVNEIAKEVISGKRIPFY